MEAEFLPSFDGLLLKFSSALSSATSLAVLCNSLNANVTATIDGTGLGHHHRCIALTSSLVRLDFGTMAAVQPGWLLRLSQPSLSLGQLAHWQASFAAVSLPSNQILLAPEVLISGPSVASACADLVDIDATFSRGSGGRPFAAVQWSATMTNASTTVFPSLTAAIAAANSAGSLSLVFSPPNMSLGQELAVRVHLRVENFLGVSTSASHDVMISAREILAYVTFDQPTPILVSPADFELIVKPSLWLKVCNENDRLVDLSQALISWSEFPPSISDLGSDEWIPSSPTAVPRFRNEADAAELVLSPKLELLSGFGYGFQMDVVLPMPAAASPIVSTARVLVAVRVAAPVAVISGGDRTLGVAAAATVDSSESFSPSFGRNSSAFEGVLQALDSRTTLAWVHELRVSWACTLGVSSSTGLHSEAASAVCHSIAGTDPVLRLDPSAMGGLLGTTLSVELTVTSRLVRVGRDSMGGSLRLAVEQLRSARTTARLAFVAGNQTGVAIRPLQLLAGNAMTGIGFELPCTGQARFAVSIGSEDAAAHATTWSLRVAREVSQGAAKSTAVSVTSIGTSVCVLDLLALQADTTYLLEAQVDDGSLLQPQSASLTLTTAGRPYGGHATLFPQVATAAKSRIVVTAQGWKAPDSSLPLTFSVVLDPHQLFTTGMSLDDALKLRGAQVMVPPQADPALSFSAAWPSSQLETPSNGMNATCLVVVRTRQGATTLWPLNFSLTTDTPSQPAVSPAIAQERMSSLAGDARVALEEAIGGVSKASAVNAFAGQLNALSALQEAAGSFSSSEESDLRMELVVQGLDALSSLAITEERAQFGAALLTSATKSCATLSSLAMGQLVDYLHRTLDQLQAKLMAQADTGAQAMSLPTAEQMAALAAVVAASAIRDDVDNATQASTALQGAEGALLRIAGQLSAASYPGEGVSELRWQWLAPCKSAATQQATMTVGTAARNGQVGVVMEAERWGAAVSSGRRLSGAVYGAAAGIRISQDFASDSLGFGQHVVASLIRWPDDMHERGISAAVPAQELAGSSELSSLNLSSPILGMTATDVSGTRIAARTQSDPISLTIPIQVDSWCDSSQEQLAFASADIARFWNQSRVPEEDTKREWHLMELAFGSTAGAIAASRWHAERIQRFAAGLATSEGAQNLSQSRAPRCYPLAGSCVFWDAQSLRWSNEGCLALNLSKNGMECICDHLSDFSSVLAPILPAETPAVLSTSKPGDLINSSTSLAAVHAWALGGLLIFAIVAASLLDMVQAGRFSKALAADASMQLANAIRTSGARASVLRSLSVAKHAGLPALRNPMHSSNSHPTGSVAGAPMGHPARRPSHPRSATIAVHDNPLAQTDLAQSLGQSIRQSGQGRATALTRYGLAKRRNQASRAARPSGSGTILRQCCRSRWAAQMCYGHAWLEIFTMFRARQARHLRVITLAVSTAMTLTGLALALRLLAPAPSLAELMLFAAAAALVQQVSLAGLSIVASLAGQGSFQRRFFTVWEELTFRRLAVRVLPKFVRSGIAEDNELADFVADVKLESGAAAPSQPVPTVAQAQAASFGPGGFPAALTAGATSVAARIPSLLLQARSRAIPKPSATPALAGKAAMRADKTVEKEEGSESDAIDWDSGSSVGSSTSSDAGLHLSGAGPRAPQRQEALDTAAAVVIDWDSDSDLDALSDGASSASSIGETVVGGSAAARVDRKEAALTTNWPLQGQETPSRRANAKALELAATLSRPDSATWLGNALTRGYRLACEHEASNLRCAMRVPSLSCWPSSQFSRFDQDEAEARVSIVTQRDRSSDVDHGNSYGVWQTGGIGCPKRNCASCSSTRADRAEQARAARRARAVRGRPDYCCWIGQTGLEEELHVNPEQCALDLMASRPLAEGPADLGTVTVSASVSSICERSCCGMRWTVKEPALERDEGWRVSERVTSQLAGPDVQSAHAGLTSHLGARLARLHLPAMQQRDLQAAACMIRLKAVSTVLSLHPQLQALRARASKLGRAGRPSRGCAGALDLLVLTIILAASVAGCLLAAASMPAGHISLWILASWMAQAAFALLVNPAAVLIASKRQAASDWATWLADSLGLVAIPLAEAAASGIPVPTRRLLGVGEVKGKAGQQAAMKHQVNLGLAGVLKANPVRGASLGAGADSQHRSDVLLAVMWREYLRMRLQTVAEADQPQAGAAPSASRVSSPKALERQSGPSARSLKRTYLDASFRKAPLQQRLAPRQRLGNASPGMLGAGAIRVQPSSRRVGVSQNTVRRSNHS